MTDHKFKVGSRVSLSSANRLARGGEFKVVRLLPAEGNDYQYRIKSQTEVAERVVKEYQLRPWKP
jgi:hypothetical protein